MLDQQKGKCAICNQEMEKPYVDHCHNTKKIRGLLCVNCNFGLGSFKDNPKLLMKAIKYLGG